MVVVGVLVEEPEAGTPTTHISSSSSPHREGEEQCSGKNFTHWSGTPNPGM